MSSTAHSITVPSSLTTTLEKLAAAIATTLLKGAGSLLSTRVTTVPSFIIPTPKLFFIVSPLACTGRPVTESICMGDSSTLLSGNVGAVPIASCSPHATTVPSFFRAKLKPSPAAMETTSFRTCHGFLQLHSSELVLCFLSPPCYPSRSHRLSAPCCRKKLHLESCRPIESPCHHFLAQGSEVGPCLWLRHCSRLAWRAQPSRQECQRQYSIPIL